MNFEMVKKELSGSKTVSVLISLFIIVASILVVISSILITTLISSNNSLSEKAYTPDVFIMSASKPDLEQIESFSTTNDNVKDFQVLEFLNIEGANININNNDSLTNSTQDNGFATQSKTMDFLLDLDGNIAFPDEGEVFVPVIYLRENKIAIDDIIFIDGVPFTVGGFIRDSIMNANLVSSKRFLIHETDYVKIKEYGSLEYLIEFNLNDTDMFSSFETDYLDYGLEINGQIISRSMIQLMNVLADSMMIVILILVSVLIIFITFICIKFILNAKVIDDYREIGVLKAIGLSVSDIKKIYSKQYLFITGASCTIGLIIAILTKDIFLKDIILFMGKPNNYNIAFIIGLLAVLLIFIIIMLYINKTLNQFKKISPVEAINMSIIPEKTKKSKLFSLKNSKMLDCKLKCNT